MPKVGVLCAFECVLVRDSASFGRFTVRGLKGFTYYFIVRKGII